MNVRRLACLFLLQLVMIASTFCGNLFAQLDPLNPPPVATHPDTPGRWVLDTVGPVGGQRVQPVGRLNAIARCRSSKTTNHKM